jgi:hypothetical protein
MEFKIYELTSNRNPIDHIHLPRGTAADTVVILSRLKILSHLAVAVTQPDRVDLSPSHAVESQLAGLPVQDTE